MVLSHGIVRQSKQALKLQPCTVQLSPVLIMLCCHVRSMFHGGKLGGSHVAMMDIIASHVGSEIRYIEDRCWSNIDPDAQATNPCVAGKVIENLYEYYGNTSI